MSANIPELVAALTLEEKASLCSGADFWHTKSINRLGIPAMLVSDGPHGLRTVKPDQPNPNLSINAVCFPAASALASSWDVEAAKAEGTALGKEAQSVHLGVLLGPAVNIKRSPLCGRNFEYFSEDPVLTGHLASALIDGIQEQGVGTSIKHFAANNQEYRRMSCSSNVTERALREIYFPAFEYAVKQSQPWTVMCSYNRINGVFASENRWLLNDVLREDWGFEGFVMSDWGATARRPEGIYAGMELEMPGPAPMNDLSIVEAVKSGVLDEADLDEAVTRILNIVYRSVDLAQQPTPVFDYAADHAKAAQLAAECAVLLKNEGVLPIPANQKVAYIGAYAAAPRYQGGGSSHITTDNVDSALSVAEAKGRSVTYVEGFPADGDAEDTAALEAAVNAAKEADVAVIFAGLPDSFESEGDDRKHMEMPSCQNRLISAVAAAQPNTVVVLHLGSPARCPWAKEVAGVLCMYLGGEGVGAAADALLYGEANPSGHLPETWPLRLQDTPSYLNFPGDGKDVNYAEDIFVGYRWYDAREMEVQWPFGYGLSYTSFALTQVEADAAALSDEGTLTVAATVKNTGSRPGKAVVQLYVADKTGKPVPGGRPPKELKAFGKVAIEPGCEGTVTMTLTARDLSWYCEETGDWFAHSGKYELLVSLGCGDAPVAVPVEFTTAKTLPLEIDANTVLADLLEDPRTMPIVTQLMNQAAEGLGLNGGADSGIMAADAVAQMMSGLPLRGIASFGGAEASKALPGIIASLQDAITTS